MLLNLFLANFYQKQDQQYLIQLLMDLVKLLIQLHPIQVKLV